MQYLRSTRYHPLVFHRQTIYVTVPCLHALMIYDCFKHAHQEAAQCFTAVLIVTHDHQLNLQKTYKAMSYVERAYQTIKGPFKKF